MVEYDPSVNLGLYYIKMKLWLPQAPPPLGCRVFGQVSSEYDRFVWTSFVRIVYFLL